MAAALPDAGDALDEYDHAIEWFASVESTFAEPLAVEVWVLDPAQEHVLLVEHRWRGWVPPGGAAQRGELPRHAAARELFEETGVHAALLPRPAAVAVRSYHPDWPLTLGLSYVAVVERTTPLSAEPGQPASWTPLSTTWTSCFPDDRDRILTYIARAATTSTR